MRVAGLAAFAAGDRFEPLGISLIAHIVEKRPSAVERGGTEIILVPRHDIAGRVTDAAADAFDMLVDLAAFFAVGRDDRKIFGGFRARLEITARILPFVAEGRHLDGEILHDREVAQRLELDAVSLANYFAHARAAGPAR